MDEAMTEDPMDPTHSIYTELWATFELAANYLRNSGNVPDEDTIERLASACDAAIRYCGNEFHQMPPPWLGNIAEVFHAMLNNGRYLRIASAED